MAIENEELVHEYFPKHLRMGTARTKDDNDTEDECKQKRVNMKRSKMGTK